ncbi:MAG: hypothetical protein LQ348_004245 [Seirophora lacunosa]|nr:MAG: hypothetical protein LQ348_004245 [Seirophora lacunosa]
MHHLLARQRSLSESTFVTSVPSTQSDQRPRAEKSAPYQDPSYTALLETLGNSYMYDSEQGITDASKALCRHLLASRYTTPKDTLFREDVFPTTCRNLQDKNEARVILDIARLLAPSPEALVAFGAKNLEGLVESVNEGWNNCVPVTSTRPQPNFAVGFKQSMFSDDQLTKLQPLLGDPSCFSYFKATYYMYFPLLTCEVKCGNIALNIADRENSHSMTVAVRGILELFKRAGREKELDGKLLTFSVSHDHRSVRLYGHYPIIDGSKTTKIYRHAIHTYGITALDGQDRWTTYHFVVAVYNHSLSLLEHIRSVIDDLPEQLLEHLEACETHLSETPLGSVDGRVGQSPLVEQQVTPDTSTRMQKAASRKKPKGKA